MTEIHQLKPSGSRSAGPIPELMKPLLAETCSIREFFSGETITRPGNGQDQVLCLLSGKAEVVVGYRAAQEVIVEHLEPGDVFGDLAFLTGRAWPSDVELVAMEPCRVLEIPMDSFQRILRENSEFTVSLLKALGKKMVRLDRSEFSAPSRVEGTDSAAVCAYPTHRGIPDDLHSRFRALALSGESVLIVGEAGVGKDVLAYAIFDAADSHKEVLVPVDMRRMSSDSFFLGPGSEADHQKAGPTKEQIRFLFGDETLDGLDRVKINPGYLELAHEGTLFVRAADRLTAVTQQKLLDALKTGRFCPLGSDRPVDVDFRLICTTEVDPSTFSPDRHPLLYELREWALVVPPLRERRDQIPDLARHYLDHYAGEKNKSAPELTELTLKAMLDYSWPGNDLELANAMRRAVIVSPGELVRRQHLTFDIKRTDGAGRYDLLRFRPVRQALLSPLFPAILQSAFVPLFLSILLLLFLGPPEPSKNLAAVVMWSLAWPGMIVGAFLAARLGCSVCAIGALSKLAKRIVSLEIPFPEALKMRSDFLIAGGILFIIWIECATDIRSSPFNLGLLLLSMFVLAFVLNTLYARQAWCRYVCPLGGMTGLLARTSLLELRADSSVCLSRCTSHDCYYGTPQVEGCTFGQVVATLHSNQFCKICGNCAKNCPYDAIKLYLRVPGRELGEVRHVRTGTGFLVLALSGGLLSDMLSRTPWYEAYSASVPGPGIVKFTVLYLGLILAVNLIALAAAGLSHRVFRERFLENYSRFALSMLPLTCMGFLAFHMYFLLNLGPQAFALLGQYFGIAALAGFKAVIPPEVIAVMQESLVGLGLLWTLITMYRLGISTPRGRYPRRLGIVPHALVSILLAAALIAVIRAHLLV